MAVPLPQRFLSLAEKHKLLEFWRSSGLPKTGFAVQNQVSVTAFSRWIAGTRWCPRSLRWTSWTGRNPLRVFWSRHDVDTALKYRTGSMPPTSGASWRQRQACSAQATPVGHLFGAYLDSAVFPAGDGQHRVLRHYTWNPRAQITLRLRPGHRPLAGGFDADARTESLPTGALRAVPQTPGVFGSNGTEAID